jgi:polysaccharide biosynthesis transport protein
MEPHARSIDPAGLEPMDSFLTQFAFAWRRKGLVLFALAVALGLGYLYFLHSDPIYQSSSQVLIIEDRTNIPIEAIENRSTSEEMHTALMRSQRVIRKAAELLNVKDGPLSKVRPEPITAGEIMGGLNVVGTETYSERGSILRLTYQSLSPEECPIILNAVEEAYRAFLHDMYHKTSDDAVELVHDAKDQLERQVTKLESEYRQFRHDSPLVVTGATAQNIHETRLKQIEEVRSQTILDNLKLRAQIDSIAAALEKGSSREALNLIVGHIETQEEKTVMPSDLTRIQHNQLFPLMMEEQMLVDRYGPDHPKVTSIRKRIKVTEEYLAQMMLEQTPEQPGDAPQQDYYVVYLESLREKININDQIIAEMTEQFEAERNASKQLMNFYVTDETYRAEIDRKSRMFEVILKRLEELNLIKDRSGVEIESIHEPSIGVQVQPNLTFILVASTALGMFTGFGLAYVVDLTDRRFRSPDDIRAELGVPVIGNIPLISGISRSERRRIVANHALQPELRSVFEPRGQIAEAYRAVRTALYFSARGGGHRVIQVTSPNPSDGKSTLAGNLAVTVAHSGKRVLLVDADFRRPRAHKLFGADNTVGVTAIIDGNVELADAIQETEVEHLSILPCGRRPKNPAELLTSRRFADLLETLREQYDLVIVDTPPVLAVTDPLNVAPRVDGVIVVLRLTKIARAAGLQTLEALEEVGAKVLGVVANGVGAGQSYSGYGYGKGKYYGGKYGNPYGYRDKAARSYYADDPEEAFETVAATSNGKH